MDGDHATVRVAQKEAALNEDKVTALRGRAIDAYTREARFAVLVREVVARAMRDYGPIDPEASRAAHDIALDAAAILLKAIYEEDGELAAQKEIADRYRKLAEEALAVAPPKLFVGRPAD